MTLAHDCSYFVQIPSTEHGLLKLRLDPAAFPEAYSNGLRNAYSMRKYLTYQFRVVFSVLESHGLGPKLYTHVL